MENTAETPFIELPEALVEEMLSKSQEIGEQLYMSFQQIEGQKEDLRIGLKEQELLGRDSDFGYPEPPTTCGVDGSYAVERMMGLDLIACAAVAIEGLTPPSEKRYWERPRHRSFICPEEHNPDSGTIIRGIMIEMELELTAKAEPDVVFLDYSLPTPLIFLNQAMNAVADLQNSNLGKELVDRFENFYETYKMILEASRTDKLWTCMPKYTSNKELGSRLNWPSQYDDRAITTLILNPGEFTKPVSFIKPPEPWHLKLPSGEPDQQLNALLTKAHVLYYKPHRWTPALRVEFSSSIAANNARLAVLLQAIKFQCATPGILEPYPLYIADRMVKHLRTAIPAFRQTATCKMAELHAGDIGDIFFNMHGYRTESGW